MNPDETETTDGYEEVSSLHELLSDELFVLAKETLKDCATSFVSIRKLLTRIGDLDEDSDDELIRKLLMARQWKSRLLELEGQLLGYEMYLDSVPSHKSAANEEDDERGKGEGQEQQYRNWFYELRDDSEKAVKLMRVERKLARLQLRIDAVSGNMLATKIDGAWKQSEYERGFVNGLVLADAVLRGNDPQYCQLYPSDDLRAAVSESGKR